MAGRQAPLAGRQAGAWLAGRQAPGRQAGWLARRQAGWRPGQGGANVPYSYSYTRTRTHTGTRTGMAAAGCLALLLGFLAEVVSATPSLGVRGTPEGPSPLQAASEKDEYKPRTGTSACTWYQERPLSGPLVSDEALLKAHRHSRQPRRRTTRMDTSLCR